jgi:hypothetical protein
MTEKNCALQVVMCGRQRRRIATELQYWGRDGLMMCRPARRPVDAHGL